MLLKPIITDEMAEVATLYGVPEELIHVIMMLVPKKLDRTRITDFEERYKKANKKLFDGEKGREGLEGLEEEEQERMFHYVCNRFFRELKNLQRLFYYKHMYHFYYYGDEDDDGYQDEEFILLINFDSTRPKIVDPSVFVPFSFKLEPATTLKKTKKKIEDITLDDPIFQLTPEAFDHLMGIVNECSKYPDEVIAKLRGVQRVYELMSE